MAGRHFLHIPGPTNVPERILRAIDGAVIDHRGPGFAPLGRAVLEGMKPLFGTEAGRIIIYPASGTGAWEAALVNTLSPGDRVLMFETGQFSALWRALAGRLGLDVRFEPGDWRHPADPDRVEAVLREEPDIRAVAVVHNDTSTGIASPVAEIRRAMDRARHPALLMVDTISSLASMPYAHDEWGVDVTVAGSQKGLMLPPGLSFNCVSEKALAASRTARLPRAYWDWEAMAAPNAAGYFPYTPATNMLYGLREALVMLVEEEGLEAVFARHRRLAAATRRAVSAWGLELQCLDPPAYSDSLTAVRVPEGSSADALRAAILERFDVSLGNGLGKIADRVFRVGHLGDCNEPMLLGALAAVEMGLGAAGVPHERGGVQAAMDFLAGRNAPA